MLFLQVMRRAKAALVIIALLATPLALVARAMACESCVCPLMCCASHRSHRLDGSGMLCGGGSSSDRQGAQCPMKSGRQMPDFGLIAPIAPTLPAPLARLATPDIARQGVLVLIESARSGFLAAPFEPPRA